MNKIKLIIWREFITRVRKPSFLIMTILGPVLIAGGLLSFTLCLDNTIISSLISGASSTFPVALISATKREIKPESVNVADEERPRRPRRTPPGGCRAT